jgi:cytidylate kinase
MIIALDGPSGTGKSTVAKGVAKRLGFTFFDTGAMYRSVAWWILQSDVDPDDQEKVFACLSTFQYEIQMDPVQERRYLVGGVDVTEAIRTPEISSLASKIAIYPQVRHSLVKIQREFGSHTDAVFEGRDMGTVVFPEADVKIFLTANPEVRAMRRFRELVAKFPDLAETFSFEQILADIKERDHKDSTRSVSPLKKAPDAVLIDTSDLTAEQVIDQVVKIARKSKKKLSKPMRISYAIVYWLARLYLKVFYRLKIYGLEHFRPGSAIIAANHASFLDPPVVSISCPEEVHFLAKESLFHIPLLGRLIRHLNSHPIARDASDASTFRLVIALLQSGQKVILFPEGQRTFDGELLPIERGLPFLAMKARCRIQPVYLEGTFQAWPRTRPLPHFTGRIHCIFGSPIEWAEFDGLDKRAAEAKMIDRMGSSLCALQTWFRSGAAGSPP